MSFRLRSYDYTPPGGYCFPGFPCAPMIEPLARQVAAFRKGNGQPRASYREALEDVDGYQCASRGNNPQFCIECTAGNPQIALAENAPGLAPCATCGAPV